MRPHVELIHEDDYIWHDAELPFGAGRARQRNLSLDEEDGSSSLRVDFVTDWGREGGVHHSDAEYFVLEGSVEVGGRRIGTGGYIHAPKGVEVPWMKFAAGSRILHYREYGDAGFDPGAQTEESAAEELIILDSAAMEWESAPTPGPITPLYLKMLHRNQATGFYSRLVWAPPGWTDHRLAHHPCYEEAYTISGRMTYNFGDLDPGTYFFRPAKVKHGHFMSGEPDGCTWLIRSDGTLINWYTTGEWIKWGGHAENYEESQAPIVSTYPVRSSSRGPWSGDGM